MDYEVEIRSFVSKEKYFELIDFFKKNAKLMNEDFQETIYLDCPQDLRIQKNDFYSKIWLKKGKMHDDQREELEIRFEKNDFEKIKSLFFELGYNEKIKWIRHRIEFSWQGLSVCIDETKGYGFIIEMEKICDIEKKDNALEFIKSKFEELGIAISSKDEFNDKFKEYSENWKSLIE